MTMSLWVMVYILINGVAALPFMAMAQRDFRRLGRWSLPVALMSGALMHGHFLAHMALSWLDRGSLFTPGLAGLLAGASLFLAGAVVIALGRRAYGEVARVYGLKEDELITVGVYRWTRNPQYVGYAAMFFGAVIASGSALATVSAILFAVFIHVFITRVEEPQMQRVFAETFEAYRRRVRRYL